MKKGNIPILVGFFLLVSLMGCSDNRDIQAVSEPPLPPPVISATLNNILQDWEGQFEFTREFQRKTGIRLEITQPPHQNYTERLFLQLSSSRVPDIIEILPENLPRLIDSEMLLPLDEFISQSRYIGSVYPEFLEVLRHPDGNLYGFPSRDGGGCVTFIRKDWLDNLGLEIPTTWDELVRVMEAFTFGDPNNSGKQDTYGYTDVASASQDWYNRLIFGEGRIEIYYDSAQGQWIDGFTTPATRQSLIRLKDLYDRGLIDPGLPTNTTYSARTKFINGQVGIFTYWANHWARNLQDRTAAADTPEAEIIPIRPIQGSRYIRRIPPVLAITREANNPSMVFSQFIDRQYDKGTIQTLFTYGVEGVHWQRQNGSITFLPNPLDPYEADFTKSYVPPGSQINDWELPLKLDSLVQDALNVFTENPYPDRQKWGGEFYNKYYLEIDQVLKPEILTSYLTGEKTLDEAMDFYTLEARKYYLSEILAELNS